MRSTRDKRSTAAVTRWLSFDLEDGVLNSFGKLIYLNLFHDGFTARCVPGDHELDTRREPQDYPPDKITAAFGHERLIIASLEHAEELLHKAIRELCARTIVKPVVIARIQHRFVNTITSTEIRALLETLQQAGARKAHIWIGQELTDDEIRNRHFPSNGVAISDQDKRLV